MRAAYDLTPFYRSLIGADHMATVLEAALQDVGGRDGPAYDIEKTSKDGYRITLAVAGFRPDELEISAQPNLLVVAGRKAETPGRAYLHQGLPLRPFAQRFELANHVVVTGARSADGLLTIDLARQIPDALKPRRIEIGAPRAGPMTALELTPSAVAA